MKYFLDCGFQDFTELLISFALVPLDSKKTKALYAIDLASCSRVKYRKLDWASSNVVPNLYIPVIDGRCSFEVATGMLLKTTMSTTHNKKLAKLSFTKLLANYFENDKNIIIVTNCYANISYFSKLLNDNLGIVKKIPKIIFECVDVKCHPNDFINVVEDNSLWGAYILRHNYVSGVMAEEQKMLDTPSRDYVNTWIGTSNECNA